ncbi:hypothetical protein J7L49_06850 [Candidatus Bathyarchaeota archaeon]|nr:hypothetical protein [Candidatus Bathyarchaeota archaeon]RJS79671.1 MAG: hypothetical protein CW708_01845 [Candidatus Bathyarchaeota archaeon]
MSEKPKPKFVRLSEDVYKELVAYAGELQAETKELQSISDAISTLAKSAVAVPPELMEEIEKIMEKRKDLGYTTRFEFVRDAIRKHILRLTGEYESIDIPKEDYERLSDVLKEMDTPFLNPTDFVYEQIKNVLRKYEEWKKQKKR